MPRLSLWLLAVGLVGFSAAAAGIPVRATHGSQVTGDEPHYLLTAMTLWEDGDLDVADEIRAERYRAWHEVGLDPQARVLDAGRMVSPHDPLLPALLAAPMGWGGWIGAKFALAAAAGVLAAAVWWLAVARFQVPRARAAVVVGVFAASAPLAAYGNQVYPEILAALATTVAAGALLGPLRRRGVAVLSLAVVALPWLSIKYVPVAATLAVIGVLTLWGRRERGTSLALMVGLGAAGALFLLAHQLWYGGWTPYATGDHFMAGEFGVVGFDPNYPGRARRLIGLLIDRDFGLGAWQPAWLLLVPALVALVRRRAPGWEVVVPVIGAGWLSATFVALTMQGWWSPGRQVVAVLPCAVLALCWWAGHSRLRTLTTSALGALGVISYAWLVADGLQRRITWAVDFFDTRSPVYRALRALMPNYLEVTASTWVLQSAWIVGLGALGWSAWRMAGERGRRERASGPGCSPRSRPAQPARAAGRP